MQQLTATLQAALGALWNALFGFVSRAPGFVLAHGYSFIGFFTLVVFAGALALLVGYAVRRRAYIGRHHR